MKPVKIIICLFIAICFALPFASQAFADDPEARKIMQQVRDRDDGDNAISEQTMILIKKKKQRVRKIKSFGKDFGEDTHSIMFFKSPADLRNTSFLTRDYADESKDDDQFLYLPGLKGKVKRIASSDKDGAFMGSDFTYGDMTKHELGKFTYDFIKKKAMVDGQECWVIKSTPINKDVVDEYGNTESRLWVRKDNHMVVKGMFLVKKRKKVRYFQVKKLEKIDGIWTATESTMKTTKGKKTIQKTVLITDKIQYNQPMDETMFTTARMEKGL